MAHPTKASGLQRVAACRPAGSPRGRAVRLWRSPKRIAPVTYQVQRFGQLTTVTVTADLAAPCFYYWYLDGVFVERTTANVKEFHLGVGDQARVEVVASHAHDLDTAAAAPDGWPARRRIWWVRSLDASVRSYRVDQKLGAGDWTELQTVHHAAEAWQYEIITGRLTDLGEYQWRVVPIDAAGNDGSAVSIASETLVRRPDSPRFAIAFDDGTTKVTFSAA